MPKRKRRDKCPQSRKKKWCKEDILCFCWDVSEETKGLSESECALKIISMATERDLLAGNALTMIEFSDEVPTGTPWDIEIPTAQGRVDKSGNITIKVGETNMIMKSVEKKKSSWVSTRNYGKRQEDLFHRQPNKDVPTKFQIETHAVKFVFGDQFTLFHSLTKFLFSISFSIRGSYISIEFATRKPSEPLMLTSTSSDLEVTMGRVMVNIV